MTNKETISLKLKTQALSKELEAKNRQLEIEASLEKVRAVAMGMKEPADMLYVCKTISLQLQSLGVKEIRNVQTAIFYESKGTYMNYEYYAKHKKTFITETLYTNHKIAKAFATKMLKGNGEIYITHLKGQKVKDWLAYQKTTNVFIDRFLEKAGSLNYYWHSLGPVALGISTYAPLSKVDLNLFNRFLNVFELAYTRYLDIEKALAQAREAKIETSLEKVRAQAMSMMKSDELLKVCESVFKELRMLGFNETDLRNTQIIINNDDKRIYSAYQYSDYTGGEIAEVPYDLHPVIRLLNDKLRQAKDAFADIGISGAALKDWKKFVNSFPQKHDAKLNAATELHYYFYSVGIGALGISSFQSLNEEKLKILQRLRNVFNLSYQRYTDIAQAEAQAREAQIETALERVRSRSMGMQKSEELKEVIKIVYQQLRQLKINLDHAGFVVDYIPHGDWTFWIADEQDIPSKITHPYFESVWANQFNEAKEKGTNLFTTLLNFKEKNKFYKKLLSYVSGLPEASKDFYLSCPGLAASTVLLENVALYIENFSGTPYSEEDNATLMRFGKVFQQTYTRFLDLKNAEAQAREAKIEAALERTRTHSMIMQHSKELDDALRVFHEQVLLLGIHSAFSFLWLPDKEKERHIFWAAWGEDQNNSIVFKSKAINYPLDRNEPATAQCLVDWKGNEPIVSYHVPPAGVENYFAAWQELIDGVEQLKPEYFSDGLYYVEAFMKYGCFGVMVINDLTEGEKKILGRFAIEFERTYTRFLDLQKAEAQAREAKIEAALEKVRSRSLAMQKPEELVEVAELLRNEMGHLGVEELETSSIYIVDKENEQAECWYAIKDIREENKRLISDEMIITFADTWVGTEMGKFYRAKTEQTSIVMKGDNRKEWINYCTGKSKVLQGYYGDEIPERTYHLVKFNGGYMGAASPGDISAESWDLLRRAASVFSLAYTRFNDLQIAEAHALQAEQDLIAIKEAKQKAEEALTELQATQKQLIQSEKMASLGELTAGIAHEIQNPLNFVNNFSDVSTELVDEMNAEIAKGNLEDAKQIAEDLRQNLEKINHHGKRAGDIVKGMLQHSRSSSTTKEPTNINKLADEYLRLAYHGLRAKDKSFNATMKTEFDETIGNIKIIPQDIGRVILNLITNAFYVVNEKALSAVVTPAAAKYEPTVSVSTKKVGDKVEIKVADNGNGIPQKILDKIFQPFFTTKPTGQGTGLGLSLSYDIVKAHGGEIKVETKEGEGSAFIIQLPSA